MVDNGRAGGARLGRGGYSRAPGGALGRLSWRSVALALPVALLLLGSLTTSVQARPARDGTRVEEAHARRTAAQEQRAAAREQRAAAREERAAARKTRHKRRERPPESERENAIVTSTCSIINWTFRKFPDLPHNSLFRRITVGRFAHVYQRLEFDGPGVSVTTPVNAPPGQARIDTLAKWRTNGAKGGFDILSMKKCPPAPALTIEKLQQIAGSGSGFTTSPLTGKVNQTVEYEIIVRNTGNVPLVLSNFSDPRCDGGTIAGGQGETPLAPGAMPSLGASTTYTCSHVLTSAAAYENTATITATPPQGNGSPMTPTSNTVVVNAPTPEPGFTIEKLQKISGSFTTSPLTGTVGKTVEYEIVVKNTGNTSLTFSSFTDEHCDGPTIAGGPGAKAVGPGESSTYTCQHGLTSADQTAGSYSNTATDTGAPPGGGPITHTSNTVVVNLPPPPSPRVYVGYADGAENDHGSASGFPTPWKGSAGVTFIGCGFGGTDSCPTSKGLDVYDAGAIRIDASSGTGALSVTGAKVVIGPCTYEPWPGLNVTIQPEQSLILTQTGKHKCAATAAAEQDNFDTSESFLKSPQYQEFQKTGTCSNDGYVPAITLTINGHATTLSDTSQTLNDRGIDSDICNHTSEAANWTQLQFAASRHFSALSCRTTTAHRRRKHATAHRASSLAGGGSRCPAKAHADQTVPVTFL
jgi:hypothetical protein